MVCATAVAMTDGRGSTAEHVGPQIGQAADDDVCVSAVSIITSRLRERVGRCYQRG
jgi:hypothetical protein